LYHQRYDKGKTLQAHISTRPHGVTLTQTSARVLTK
jgi:hypothetical protein